jgi:ABC-type amino acid transport substrate-binding protein
MISTRPAKARSLLRLAWFLFFITTTLHSAPLKVGAHDKPPFCFKNPNGSWTGLSVEVWKEVAARAGLEYELVEVPFEMIREGVANGTLDAAIGEIAVTADDEKVMDFTQPFLISPVGIAVRDRPWKLLWSEAIEDFLNWTVGQFVIGILVLMLVVSLLIWVAERRHHAGHFQGGIHGIGAALWFSAVTMTTVGYGDVYPQTPLGKMLGSVIAELGIAFFALPAGILASGFSEERERHSTGNRDSVCPHCGRAP